jgi:hypothetical protein
MEERSQISGLAGYSQAKNNHGEDDGVESVANGAG